MRAEQMKSGGGRSGPIVSGEPPASPEIVDIVVALGSDRTRLMDIAMRDGRTPRCQDPAAVLEL